MDVPALPASAVDAYERLRGEVLGGGARPEGLGAIVYHGLVEGLRRVCAVNARAPAVTTCKAPGADPGTPLPAACQRDLLHLLANMVLEVQAEVTHVY